MWRTSSLARIDAGVLTLELHEARLGDLVSSCLRALDAEARARNIRLAAHVDPADPTVRIAPEKIERVLLNLLTNAVRHTPSDGAVSVVVQPEPERVVVAVEDTGDGLTPNAARRMFERFWRDDEARTRSTGGAGLLPSGQEAGAHREISKRYRSAEVAAKRSASPFSRAAWQTRSVSASASCAKLRQHRQGTELHLMPQGADRIVQRFARGRPAPKQRAA